MSDGGASIEQLIASAREGDGHALSQLLDRVRDPLLAQLAAADGVADGVHSTEIVSETLEVARDRFGQFDGSTQNHLLGWLSGILHQYASAEGPKSPHFAHQRDATLQQIADGSTQVLLNDPEAFAAAETLSVQSAQSPSPFEETLHLKPERGAGESRDAEADEQARSKRRPESAPTRFGKYELESMIAKGGMGVVYKARDTKLNRTVALKMILSGSFAGEGEIARFYAEAEAAAKLRHPNIVAIHEFGEVDGQHFFSMDYIEGGGLAGLVRENALPPEEAAALVKTVAEAMHYAHEKGILHRDLKPSNVLLDHAGAPMITDFGLAKQVEGHSGLTVSGTILGTPSYMPPEQAAGHIEDVQVPSDVYSIGAILYELLTGRPPFRAANAVETLKQVLEKEPVSPRLLNPSIPADIETICLKCLQKEPAARYATAQELTEELDRFLAGEPILARPIGRVARLWRWCRRKPKVAALVGIALLAGQIALTATIVGYIMTSSALTRAEQSLGQVRTAINDLYVIVSEEELLNSPGMQPVRKKLLAKASELFKQVLEQQGDRPELREDLALSYYRLGRIMQDLDRPLEALTVLNKARAMAEALVSESRTKEHRAALGDITNVIGEVLEKMDRLDDALAIYDQAIRIRETLVDGAPNNAEYGRKLANALMNSGLIERAIAENRQNPADRERRFRSALARCETAQARRLSLLEKYPDDMMLRLGLAKGYYNIGMVSEDGEAVLENLQNALGQYGILLSHDEGNLEFQFQHAVCRLRIGDLYRFSDQPKLAQENYVVAIERLEEIADSNEEVHKYQGVLAGAYLNQGLLYETLQEYGDALDSYRAAEPILRRLVDEDGQRQYQQDLDTTLASIATLEAR